MGQVPEITTEVKNTEVITAEAETAGQAPDVKQSGQEEQGQTFSLEYVKELRNEAAANRVRVRELEEQIASLRASGDRAAELEKSYTTLIEQVSERNKQRVEAVPETLRPLVPEFDDPLKLQRWLDNSLPLLSRPVAPVMNAGAGKSDRPSDDVVLTEQQLEVARRAGVSPEKFAEQLRAAKAGSKR